MDTFEILTEICEMRDKSVATGIPVDEAEKLAQQRISEKYHISHISVKKMTEN